MFTGGPVYYGPPLQQPGKKEELEKKNREINVNPCRTAVPFRGLTIYS